MNKGIIFLMVLFLLPVVFAIPENMSINGRLTDSSGTSLSGTYSMNLSIYNTYTGGTALWNSTQNVTTDSNGVFSAMLRNVNLNFSDNYFLGVAVGSDSEMTPRVNLTSSGYAFRAKNISVGGVEFDADVNATSRNITTTGNMSASWFKGIFNWLIGSSSSNYLTFNGTQLDFNETYSNLTYVRLNQNNSIGNYNFSINTSTFFVDAKNQRVGIGTTGPLATLHVNGTGATLNISNQTNSHLFVNGTTGYVGIGTTTPGAMLDVVGALRTTSTTTLLNTYRSTGSGTTGRSVLQLLRDTGVENGWDLGSNTNLDSTDNFVLRSIVSGTATSRLVVTPTTGNVGINSTTPQNTLDVKGNANVTGLLYVGGSLLNVTDNSTIVFTNQNNSIGNFNFSINTSTFFVDAKNQRVGIGTTGPLATLHVNGTDATLNISNQTNSHLFVNGTTGYVGIGTTTTPTQGRLQITENAGTSAQRGLSVTQHNTGVHGALINFLKSRGTESSPTTIVSEDYGGIFVFQNYDGTAYRANANFGYKSEGIIGTDSIPGELFFAVSQASDNNPYVGGSVRMVLQSNGNVGIGTTSPNATLHINGTAGGFLVNVTGSSPILNTTTNNVTITSAGGSVVIQLG